jgi:hypothetical protein
MEKLIECGERTVQKMGRISIADIMKSHNLEPGDVVVVDVKIPFTSDGDDIASCSSKQAAMSAMDTIEIARRMLKHLLDDNSTFLDKAQFEDIFKLLRGAKSELRIGFSISKEEFKEYIESEWEEDFEEDPNEDETEEKNITE